MIKGLYTITINNRIAPDTYLMSLRGDTSALTAPGQFVNVELEGLYLRRPISVCDWDGETLTIVYKVVGKGTAQMAAMRPGRRLDLLTGLGNGYDTAPSGDAPLLVGGGAGVPPLYALAKRLKAEGKHPAAVLGFNTAREIFLREEFKSLGVPVTVSTADGSDGVRGFVTAAIPEEDGAYTYVYTCGPEPMLKAVYEKVTTSGQFSFEARMGCGFGACMGCSCKTKYGTKRICVDGPVLTKEEIVW